MFNEQLFNEISTMTRRQRGEKLGDLESGPAYDEFLRTLEEVENMEEIETSRRTLNSQLKHAIAAVRAVANTRADLVHLFDVEHAEGSNLFEQQLTAAATALEIADQINPTRPDSETVRIAKANLNTIAGLVEACPTPDLSTTSDGPIGFRFCTHGQWPCRDTQIAWLAAGHDPDTQQQIELDRKRAAETEARRAA